MRKFFEKKKGQPIAVLCARYWYRGIIVEVEDDYIVLSQPYAVEETGRAMQETPNIEDQIPDDIAISYGAIELACQPIWCFAGYDFAKKYE